MGPGQRGLTVPRDPGWHGHLCRVPDQEDRKADEPLSLWPEQGEHAPALKKTVTEINATHSSQGCWVVNSLLGQGPFCLSYLPCHTTRTPAGEDVLLLLGAGGPRDADRRVRIHYSTKKPKPADQVTHRQPGSDL